MFTVLRNYLLGLPLGVKRALMLGIDLVLIPLSLWLAVSIRLSSFFETATSELAVFIILPLLTIPVFAKLGLYRAVMRYIGLQAIVAVEIGAVVSAGLLWLIMLVTGWLPVSPTISITYGLVLMMLVGGSRVIVRGLLSEHRHAPKTPVVIYGAGSSGRQLVHTLSMGAKYRPVAFLDDDSSLQRRFVENIEVIDPRSSGWVDSMLDQGVRDILLCIPSATRSQRRTILAALENLPFHVQTVPGMDEILTGRARIDDIREVQIEDLLGREPVPPNEGLLDKCITGKTVLVTGAAGSIGSELCRQVIEQEAGRLILYDHSEFGLYTINVELNRLRYELGRRVEVVPLLGSVTDTRRLEEVFSVYGIDTVYHAAAYKHVPMVERNPIEGLRVNVFGTYSVADCARRHGVKNFVLISTDKAVRPTNVMGASKRMAELSLQAMAREGGATVFTMVRFGNVLGSSGSVVPLFREQIRRGGPVTITHKEITRFFMTIPEAVQLVIQAGAMGGGGDVFVLDMGDPVKIDDMARHMIRLSGLEVVDDSNPDGDIEIVYTGLRPGEKLYEELLIGDDVTGTEHPKIMRAEEEMLPMHELSQRLDRLRTAMERGDHAVVRTILLESVKGYIAGEVIEDYVWLERQTLPCGVITVH